MSFTSRAGRAPKPHHRRRHRVTGHALERFRERVAEEFLHRPDDDLRYLLDDWLAHPEERRVVDDPRAPGIPTDLIAFVGRGGCRYWAVVREATVVTVLDDGMARRNFEID